MTHMLTIMTMMFQGHQYVKTYEDYISNMYNLLHVNYTLIKL